MSQERGEFVLYEIAELPEGFVKDEESSFSIPSGGKASTTYRKGAEFFVLEQHYADVTKNRLNTENVELTPVTIGDIEGYSFVNEGFTNYLWTEDGFVFLLYGNIDSTTLETIACSIKPQ